ncbi:MAG: hypothetical protein M3Q74_01775 [Pseudomonadota bacterium]|nr:hypothetical protein [Pseudomonadota bacterium]
MIGIALAAALALAPQQSLSGSSNALTEADFRCYAAGVVMAGVSGDNEEMLNAAGLIAFYYLGRLEGREPDVDWIEQGIKVGNAQPDLLMAELARCGTEFEAKGKAMVDKGTATES